jgi:hypothetical protein
MDTIHNNNAPLAALKYHVTGAIERGEKQAIVEQRPLPKIVTFAIIGRRPNGEVLHYCSSHTQGSRFVPSAYSLADVFTDSDIAEVTLERLAPKWRGLKLEIERRVDSLPAPSRVQE